MGLVAVATIGYGVYCQSIGRPILIFLCLIMMPLATTELGTDGAITGNGTPLKDADCIRFGCYLHQFLGSGLLDLSSKNLHQLVC